MAENHYIKSRKLNCSVVLFISQSYFKIPEVSFYMVLLKLSEQREVIIILSEIGLGITKEELTAL
jgi:hypothetical protein